MYLENIALSKYSHRLKMELVDILMLLETKKYVLYVKRVIMKIEG